MAVSGIILIGYLLAHMYGNLKVFAGQAAFDEYAHHLRTIGEPVLPHTGLLWVIRVVLLVAVVGHAYAAFKLWTPQPPRPGRRQALPLGQGGPGRAALVQLVHPALGRHHHRPLRDLPPAELHLAGDHPGRRRSASPYERVVNGFSVWWLVAAYTVAMLAVGFHLRHGTWSALTTLGLNTSTVARHRLNLIAYAVAGVVTVGFLLPPFSILFGLVS